MPTDDASDARIAALVRELLQELGEDPDREGLVRTPLRVAKSWRFLTKGYAEDPRKVIGSAMFEEIYDEMVIVKDVEFYSCCEHHMLPFFGKAHIAYIPNGKVVGLSKLARITDIFARRLQVQERMTREIAETLMEELRPHGVAVAIEGAHMCMAMRGVQKQNSVTVTTSLLGEFKSNPATRAEFYSIIGAGGHLRR